MELQSRADDILAALRPTTYATVHALLKEAKFDLLDWSMTRDLKELENPAENRSKNSLWAFIEDGKPAAVCVWHKDLIPEGSNIVYKDNFKDYKDRLANEANRVGASQSEKSKAAIWRRKAADFDQAIRGAFLRRQPIRMILVRSSNATAATHDESDLTRLASRADKRLLDSSEWYVHEHDAYTGAFRVVRGVKPPPVVNEDLAWANEADRTLQEIDETAGLSETEKKIIAKARIGQGRYRDRLIDRWNGCSVSGCNDTALLIASHIVPWSICTTATERWSVDNGLLLTPHLDKLFELGLIGFNDKFKIIISRRLRIDTRLKLNVDHNMKLTKSFPGIRPYLEKHRATWQLSQEISAPS